MSTGPSKSKHPDQYPSLLLNQQISRFPKFENVHPLNCTIEGDVLYLPSYWWHEVQSYPSTQGDRNLDLAVNFWNGWDAWY